MQNSASARPEQWCEHARSDAKWHYRRFDGTRLVTAQLEVRPSQGTPSVSAGTNDPVLRKNQFRRQKRNLPQVVVSPSDALTLAVLSVAEAMGRLPLP
jgi:hypothetical protein